MARRPETRRAAVGPGEVDLAELVFGARDSDSVRRLQQALNEHPLTGGATLPVTGDYLDLTDAEVRKCQKQHGFGNDPVGGSSVGPRQAKHLFAKRPDVVDAEPAAGHTRASAGQVKLWMHYSGKPGGTMRVREADGWVPIDVHVPDPPLSGSEHHMLYARVFFVWKAGSEFAKVECKYVRADNDETAFDERHYEHGTKTVPFQQMHFEEGEAGLGGRWFMRVHGGASAMDLTTRYCKSHVLGFRS